MRVLGLDVGSRRIGAALSDPGGILASPHSVIERREPEADVRAIAELAAANKVERLVVGVPYSMSGALGAQAGEVLDFVRLLTERVSLPIEIWDERLSTVAAQRMMALGGSKKKGRKERVDAVAAAIILQAYLDSIYSGPGASAGNDGA